MKGSCTLKPFCLVIAMYPYCRGLYHCAIISLLFILCLITVVSIDSQPRDHHDHGPRSWIEPLETSLKSPVKVFLFCLQLMTLVPRSVPSVVNEYPALDREEYHTLFTATCSPIRIVCSPRSWKSALVNRSTCVLSAPRGV